jgi:membrane protein
VFRRYHQDHAGRWSTIIAWNALFAFIPIVLVVVTILGLLLAHHGFAQQVESRIASLGQTAAERNEIRAALNGFRQHSGVLAAVSIVGLLWGGSALFTAMDDALSNIYGAAARRFVRKRLRAVAMIFVFTLLIIPLLLSSTLLSVGQRFSLLPAGFPGAVAAVLQFVLGALDGALIFAVIYRFVPNRRMPLRRALPGAVFAGVLLEAFTLLFPAYVRATDGFATYGVIFALLLLLITYFFFLGQITVIGALVNVELEEAAT